MGNKNSGKKSICKIDGNGRECVLCHKYKPWMCYRNGNERHGYTSRCKDCLSVRPLEQRNWNKLRVDDGGRECRKCRTYKPWGEYGKRKEGSRGGLRGYNIYCRECYKWICFKGCFQYGITFTDYKNILLKQGGVCAICKCSEKTKKGNGDGKARSLSIDHDHKTGKVRGLLCANCNSALGLIGENVNRLATMIEYLSRKVS